MAFFDKVKDAADKGLSKAKDLGELGAAKAKIAVIESKIKDVYEEIGKTVFEAGGVVPEGGIAELMEKISGFMTEIEQIKASLDDDKEAEEQ